MSAPRTRALCNVRWTWWLPRLGWPVVGAVAILTWQREAPPALPPAPAQRVPAQPGSGHHPVPVAEAHPPAPGSPGPQQPTTPKPWHWSELESCDYETYIRKLRAAGCPEQTIVDLVVMDVGRMYQARREQLEAAGGAARSEPDEAWQALASERDQLVRHLVGADFRAELQPLTAEFNPGTRLPRLGFLPLAKQVSARRLLAVAQEQEEHLVQSSGGVLEESQTAELNALRERTERQLQALLTAEELATYRTQAAGP